MKLTICICLLFNILFSSNLIYANSVVINLNPGDELAKISTAADGSFTVSYNNNVFGFFSKTSDVTKIHDVNAEISSNTCIDNAALMTCKFKVHYIIENVVLGWVAHEDPEKVNTIIIEDEDDEAEAIFSAYNFWAWDNQGPRAINEFNYPSNTFSNKLTKPQLICSDYNWLPSQSNSIDIMEWTTETNTQNLETAKNENRASNVLFNVKGQKTNSAITFDTFESRYAEKSNFIDFLTYILGDVVNWTLKKDERFCQITFKSNSTLLLASIFQVASDLTFYENGLTAELKSNSEGICEYD